MKIIQRTSYIEELRSVKGTPDIKVITGVRRSGKSKLLEAFCEDIKLNEPSSNIIYIDYTSDASEQLMEYHALNNFVKQSYIEGVENYLFIDEVQLCDGFEKAINWLYSSGKYDIYITGSNAFLLSSDLATLFTGRTYQIEVFPFSLQEYMVYNSLNDQYDALPSYVTDGGMSGSYLYQKEEQKYKYLADVFETLIVRDIKQKYKLRNTYLLSSMVDYMLDNISNLTSARRITAELEKNKTKSDHKTVSKYINYLCNAYAFYPVKRYDLRGKRYLASQEKYYLCDASFKYAILGTRNLDEGRTLENIVAIELKRRGYQIYVGVLYKKEIDFVAIKQKEKMYIQVSASIENKETLERELAPLKQIKDSYPKILLAKTRTQEYDIEGIRIIDIADWLVRIPN